MEIEIVGNGAASDGDLALNSGAMMLSRNMSYGQVTLRGDARLYLCGHVVSIQRADPETTSRIVAGTPTFATDGVRTTGGGAPPAATTTYHNQRNTGGGASPGGSVGFTVVAINGVSTNPPSPDA